MNGSNREAVGKTRTVHLPEHKVVTFAKRAFTVLELMVVVVVTCVMVVLFLPAVVSHRPQRVYNCTNNLKQIGLAFRIWAGDNQGSYPMEVSTNDWGSREFIGGTNVFPHFRCMSNELNNPKVVLCSMDEKRTPATDFNADFDNSHVSYFVGLDCKGNDRSESADLMIIGGDRNLTTKRTLTSGLLMLATNQPVRWTRDIHKRHGNLLQTDGSVLWNLTDGKLEEALAKAGKATNRLVLP